MEKPLEMQTSFHQRLRKIGMKCLNFLHSL
jgi:hypothetical protein